MHRVMLSQLMLALFLLSPQVFAADTSADETSAAEVKEEVAESAEAIREYSAEQRDEAVQAAKETLARLDARIEAMQAKLDENWDEMDQAARQRSSDALKALKRQRTEVAEWYGGMKHSSAEAWEDVKKGFVDSYRSLGDAFGKAWDEF